MDEKDRMAADAVARLVSSFAMLPPAGVCCSVCGAEGTFFARNLIINDDQAIAGVLVSYHCRDCDPIEAHKSNLQLVARNLASPRLRSIDTPEWRFVQGKEP